MKQDIPVQEGVVIPGHEIEISMSRSSGPGGQNVNKSNTRVTIHWNVQHTKALTDEQKARVLLALEGHLTHEGAIVIHNSESRSQEHNKHAAFEHLAQMVRKALYVPKKRMKTRAPKAAEEQRLQEKARRGLIKKLRSGHDE